MKLYNTAFRLNELMKTNNLKQVDIVNMVQPYCKEYRVKINKSDISQYCSGKVEPGQNKVFVLALALNVSEAWLLGYDVPINRIDDKRKQKNFYLSEHEEKVITAYRSKPHMQPSVDKLLDVEEETIEIYSAARNGEPAGWKKVSKEYIEALENTPDVEDDFI